ncbi:MAG: MarR family transcriptional regulator [Rhizobacter sp.]|nr:MarR family transcriptional regulator [Rhizobacter sp.]
MQKLDLDTYIPSLLLWVSNKMSASATQLYSSKFGIGVTDWRVLAYFEAYPWTTASSAGGITGIDKAAISRSVAFLVESGWLRSRPEGLRKIEYATSASGKRLYARVYVRAMERQEALLTGVSSEQRALLAALLRTMLGNLDAVARVGQDRPSLPARRRNRQTTEPR